MKETLKHKEAFERYYAMGAERSLASLAGDCRVSEKSVKSWSVEFDWQARIEQRDMENARRLQKVTDETVVAVKAKYRKVIGAAISTFVKKLNGGEIAVESVGDLERLIKLDLLLMGEATEKTDHSHHIEEMFGLANLDDIELKQRLADAAGRLASGSLPPSS